MKITADLRNEFWHWINENWQAAGGLVTHSIGAAMMGKTQTRIRQMVQEGKLKEYRFKSKKFLSYCEVYNLTREEAYKDLENATSKLFSQGEKMFLKAIKEQAKGGKSS